VVIDIIALAQQCAPDVHVDTIQRIVHVESSYNPYAIGVVGAHLERQPRTLGEAISTARWLEANGYNFSVGLAQVNKSNFSKYGLTLEKAFQACPNLRAGGEIIKECFGRAKARYGDEQAALRAAFSCYYSGNFSTGFDQGYVLRIVKAGAFVPALKNYSDNDRKALKPAGKLPITGNGTNSVFAAPEGAGKLKQVNAAASPATADDESPSSATFTDRQSNSRSALLF